MTVAADVYTWADYEAGLKAYFGLTGDSSEDATLRPFLEAAAIDLDDYVGWYYTDDDDEIVDESPTDAEWTAGKPMLTLGIYEWVRAARAMFASAASEGVQSVKTGALSEVYQGGGGGMSIEILARRAALPMWSSTVYNLLRTAKAS